MLLIPCNRFLKQYLHTHTHTNTHTHIYIYIYNESVCEADCMSTSKRGVVYMRLTVSDGEAPVLKI